MKFLMLIFFMSVMGFASEFSAMEKACDRKVATACYELGSLYEEGLGVEANSTKAKEYYNKACENEFDKACLSIENIGKK